MKDLRSITISPDERSERRQQVLKSLRDKAYRDEFVRQQIETGLPFQIKGMRKSRNLSQAELGDLLGKPQSVVSRLENAGYGRFNIQTLREIASAFDVALLVAFVPFGSLANRVVNFSVSDVEVPAFSDDPSFQAQSCTESSGVVVDFVSHKLNQTKIARPVGIAVTDTDTVAVAEASTPSMTWTSPHSSGVVAYGH